MKLQVHQIRCSRITRQSEKGVLKGALQQPFQVLVYGKCGEVFKLWSGENERQKVFLSPTTRRAAGGPLPHSVAPEAGRHGLPGNLEATEYRR